MATFTSYRVRTVRHIWAVPKPANHAEIGKAHSAAIASFKQLRGHEPVDDEIYFDCDDENILIYFEAMEQVS